MSGARQCTAHGELYGISIALLVQSFEGISIALPIQSFDPTTFSKATDGVRDNKQIAGVGYGDAVEIRTNFFDKL